MFTKKNVLENQAILDRARQLLDPNDLSPLNHRADKERILSTLINEFEGVKQYRIENQVCKAIRQMRG